MRRGAPHRGKADEKAFLCNVYRGNRHSDISTIILPKEQKCGSCTINTGLWCQGSDDLLTRTHLRWSVNNLLTVSIGTCV